MSNANNNHQLRSLSNIDEDKEVSRRGMTNEAPLMPEEAPPETATATTTTAAAVPRQRRQKQRSNYGSTRNGSMESARFGGIVDSTRSGIDSQGVNFGIPTQQGAQDHVAETHGEEAWQSKILHALHLPAVQTTLMILLILDVFILFAEIFLLASFPYCHTITRDAISCCPATHSEKDATADYADDSHLRWLAGSSHGDHDFCEDGFEANYDYPAGCDAHKWHTVHTIESVLFICTMAILVTFMVELNLEMIALTPRVFFNQFFYALDYIVITISIALEALFHALSKDDIQSVIGLLVVVRIWRFVRIGHGLVEVTSEWTHQNYDQLLQYTEELEVLCQKNNITLPESSKEVKRQPSH